MRLPEHIYAAAKPIFAHHSPWHNARKPENGHLRGPGTHFADLKGTNEPGSGEQFLRFHRDMARVFKWILENTPGPAYAYSPWDRLPQWLAGLFDSANPTYLQTAYSEIDRLITLGNVDDLGNFIEATLLSTAAGSDIHNRCHGTIGAYEISTFGATNPRLTDAGMRSFGTAPHNEHFWGLHGWIDNVLAAWQGLHGEVVDQSPLRPEDLPHHHLLEASMAGLEVMSNDEEAKILKPIWE